MKLKHWMESLSRSRKKSKPDSSSTNPSFQQQTSKDKTRVVGKKLTVKDIIMPASGERKHVRNNYPAVAAYLDHRHPLSTIQNLKTFRPVAPTAWTYKQESPVSNNSIYDIPEPQCACFRHKKVDGKCDDMERSFSSFTDDFNSSTTSGSVSQRRVNIRTNPWIRPEPSTLQREKPMQPPPKPMRKRPPIPFAREIAPYQVLDTGSTPEDDDMVICSDKSVGTDGDESLLDDNVSSYCGCDDCCDTGSCHSFSSLKKSSTNSFNFSSETIQPDDSDNCSVASTPTILNDFECRDSEGGSERDSAVGSPGSNVGFISSNITPSASSSSHSRPNQQHRQHFSPAGSHTSWKYFDDEDEHDSGHPTTASSLGSPGSFDDYSRHVSNSSTRMLLEDQENIHMDNGGGFDIDTNIEIIRHRLQKQVYALKHETTVLDQQMGYPRDFYQSENLIEQDYMRQKKNMLVETLGLLKRQLDEQNDRLHTSYSALQNLHKRQINRHEPRNRDGRALSALYNQSLRETFC